MVTSAIEMATTAQALACNGFLEVSFIVYFFGLVFFGGLGTAFAASSKHLQGNCDERVENV
jgi:hypothetical protein